MLRFILKNRNKDQHTGLEYECLYTVDIEVPELESALARGGRSEYGYDRHDLVGVELIEQPASQGEKRGK